VIAAKDLHQFRQQHPVALKRGEGLAKLLDKTDATKTLPSSTNPQHAYGKPPGHRCGNVSVCVYITVITPWGYPRRWRAFQRPAYPTKVHSGALWPPCHCWCLCVVSPPTLRGVRCQHVPAAMLLACSCQQTRASGRAGCRTAEDIRNYGAVESNCGQLLTGKFQNEWVGGAAGGPCGHAYGLHAGGVVLHLA
jgi:hypothetical protein